VVLVIEDEGVAQSAVSMENAEGVTEQIWRMAAMSSPLSIHLRPTFLPGNRPQRSPSASQRSLQGMLSAACCKFLRITAVDLFDLV
jgi:hypothetical protein